MFVCYCSSLPVACRFDVFFVALFCCQHGETACQLARRADCEDIANLISTQKKVKKINS